MKLKIVFLTFLLYALKTSASPACGRSEVQGGRIIGGRIPKRDQWPWQAVLLNDFSPYCGGTLIAPDWVLTAAHCMIGVDKSKIHVGVGFFNLFVFTGAEELSTPEHIIIHPQYDDNNVTHKSHDIALIKLSVPFTINKHAQPACLPTHPTPPRSKCYITGWGKVRHPGEISLILQQAAIDIVSYRECAKLNDKHLNTVLHSRNMICAGSGSRTNPVASCQGDSGGPMVCRGKGNRWEVAGIHSYGESRCRSHISYSVFTNVHRYLPWINKVMNND